MATRSPATPSAMRSCPTRTASSQREILARLRWTPAALQASIIWRHSSTSRAIGFSSRMCLPGRGAARTFGGVQCAVWRSRPRRCPCGRAATRSRAPPRAPNSAARAGARVPPATATTRARPASCSVIATAWIWAIPPAPINPNPTVILVPPTVWNAARTGARLDDACSDGCRLTAGGGEVRLDPRS